MPEQKLKAVFQNRGVMRGGILFLRSDDAVALIEAARQAGIRVLGIDGFLLGPESTEPSMEHSIDYSSWPRQSGCWTEASIFVRSQPSDFVFEVVLDE